MRAALRNCIVFFSGFCTIAALSALFVFRHLESAPPLDDRVVPSDSGVSVETGGAYLFVVEQGETATSVGERLHRAGLIRSPLLWSLLSRIDSEKIKAGTYRIEGPIGTLAVRELFVSGKQILMRVTVPEGFTLKKIASLLAGAGIVDEDSFLSAAADPRLLRDYGIPGQSFEGYLFPDTYFFPRSYPAERTVRAMVDTFFRRIQEVAPKRIDSYDPGELHDLVTLASIIEREYRVSDEAPLIAGVFNNRLRIGMALQSCATVEYVITEIQGRPHPEVLYNRDIAIVDPYNTYINRGLPPGPISAPGQIALDAAFNPAPSDYLYFRLADPSEGRHRFSRTLDDHIKAGVIYVKRVRAGQ